VGFENTDAYNIFIDRGILVISQELIMCCRFALYSDPISLAKRFSVEPPPDLRPRYNIAPWQTIPIEESGAKVFCSGPLGTDSALGEGYKDWLAQD
jgi:hypothetical protein